MEVKYTIEGRDYWSFSKYTLLHAPVAWTRWFAITLLLPCGATLLAFEWLRQPMARFAAIACVTLVWVAFRIFRARRFSYKQAAKDPAELQISMMISEDGFAIQRKSASGRLTWQNVARITQTPDYIYLFFNRTQAAVIPKRAFASPEEAAAFYTAATQYRANSKLAPSLQAETPIPADALTIDYELTLEDYAQFYKERMAGRGLSRTVVIYFMSVLLIGMGSALVSVSYWGTNPRDRPDLSMFAFGTLLIFLGAIFIWTRSPWYFRYFARRMAKAVPGMIGRHTISLLPDALVEKTPLGNTRFSWNDLSQVVDGAHTISISQRATAAFIIPKRAFATDSDATAFLHLAREYLNRVQTGVYRDPGDSKGSWPPAPSAKREPPPASPSGG